MDFLESNALQNLLLLVTAIIVLWYTIETFRLRKEAQKTNNMSMIPLIFTGFNLVNKTILINTRDSKNPALNYKLYAVEQNSSSHKQKLLEAGLVISTENVYEVKCDFWDTRMNYFYRIEYEDILGNRYASEWQPNDPKGIKFEIL